MSRRPRVRPPVRNAMTVDVEDYFQVQAFADCIDRAEWQRMAPRVEADVDRIDRAVRRGGSQRHLLHTRLDRRTQPALVRRIVAAGHELASHGYDHTRADPSIRPTSRADVSRTRRLLEDIAGSAVQGYRAATFSIGARNPWAFRVLEDAGYSYSSSVYPVRHDLYGMPDASRFPFHPRAATLWEFPMTTVRPRPQLALLAAAAISA